MRRYLVIGILLLAGCQSVSGPFTRRPERVEVAESLRFLAGSRYLLTNAGEGSQLWQLEAAPLPTEDLTGLGQIFSGLRVDPTGALEALPLPVQTNLYASLRTRHPKYFSLNDKPFNTEPIRPHIQVPARNADTALEQIDLSPYYNARLDESWQGGDPGNDLAKLPIGVQLLDGVRFDVRGLVQLTSQSAFSYQGRSYPNRVGGMKLHVKCHYLHFLQAAGWRVPLDSSARRESASAGGGGPERENQSTAGAAA